MDVQRITDVPALPPRQPSGHKGSFGRVLIVAGSRGMSGAACLAGKSALRGGAGLVTVASPSEVVPIVASYEPSYLTLALDDADGLLAPGASREILERKADVLALGPGLGQSRAVQAVVLEVFEHASTPLVVDADGLNCLVGHLPRLCRRSHPTILTPHPGEFARLTGDSIKDIQAAREQLAVTFASQQGVVLVLKGNGSVVTDGRRLFVNETGNAGMATGGTGDVLTGLIAALVAQGLEAFDAARLAVHLHGLAGDIVAETGSPIALIASDLIDALPNAWRALAQRKSASP